MPLQCVRSAQYCEDRIFVADAAGPRASSLGAITLRAKERVSEAHAILL